MKSAMSPLATAGTATYAVLAKQYGAPRLKGPLNLDARRAAGFDEAELALLSAGA